MKARASEKKHVATVGAVAARNPSAAAGGLRPKLSPRYAQASPDAEECSERPTPRRYVRRYRAASYGGIVAHIPRVSWLADDEQDWFDFELVSLEIEFWLCRRISRIQLLWCSHHWHVVLLPARVAFHRRGLAETTLRLIGSFLMAGPTTARVALRLAGMMHVG